MGVLVAWGLFQLLVRRPPSIAGDWNGWRQADTQTIALHFAQDGLDVLHPRIDWGGAGPGYVETELQLYPTVVAVALRLFGGRAEWPGQAVSLVAMGLAFFVLFRVLLARFGRSAAFVASSLLLTSRGVVYLSTAIQPDNLGFLAFASGLAAFLAFLEDGSAFFLALAMAATAIAGLIKPTLLQLGIVQFLLVVLLRRDLLRRLDLWLGWLAVIGLVAGSMLHAYGLFLRYGNTFGIIGGESKVPGLPELLSPALVLALASRAVYWGTGIPAVVAALFLLARRRIDRTMIALAAGGVAMSLVGMRYGVQEGGTHYHIPLVALGAFVLAAAWRLLTDPLGSGARTALLGVASLLVAGQYAFFLWDLRQEPPRWEIAMGQALASRAGSRDLVVVRSRTTGYDDVWQTEQNFEDPRVFYVAKVRGWALPSDRPGIEPVQRLAERGAKYYVEITRAAGDPELHRWLEHNARLLVNRTEGRIWSFDQSPGPSSLDEGKGHT